MIKQLQKFVSYLYEDTPKEKKAKKEPQILADDTLELLLRENYTPKSAELTLSSIMDSKISNVCKLRIFS